MGLLRYDWLGNNPCSCNRTVTYPLMSEFMDNCNIWIIHIIAINQHFVIMFSWLNICIVHESMSVRWSLRVYILIIVAACYRTQHFIFNCQFSVASFKYRWTEIFINRLNILIVVLDSVRFYMLGYEWTVALPMHISIGKTLFQVLRAPVAVSKVHTTSFSNARTTYYSETDTFQTTSTNSTLMICFTVYPMPLRQRMKYCSLKSKTLYFILKGSFK